MTSLSLPMEVLETQLQEFGRMPRQFLGSRLRVEPSEALFRAAPAPAALAQVGRAEAPTGARAVGALVQGRGPGEATGGGREACGERSRSGAVALERVFDVLWTCAT